MIEDVLCSIHFSDFLGLIVVYMKMACDYLQVKEAFQYDVNQVFFERKFMCNENAADLIVIL